MVASELAFKDKKSRIGKKKKKKKPVQYKSAKLPKGRSWLG